MAKKTKVFPQTINVVHIEEDDFLLVLKDNENMAIYSDSLVATYELKSIGKVRVETTIEPV